MAKRTEPGKVKRSIYFYNLYTYTVDQSDDQKMIVEKNSQRLSTFFTALQDRQHKIQDNNYSDFFINLSSGDQLLVLVDEQHESKVFFRMILSRINALPQIETNGNLKSLGDLIEQNQNIAEVTHCIYYRHYATMGAEFNFSGAYPSKIANYINVMNERSGSSYVAECSSKLDDDVFRKLDKDGDFSLFDLSLRNDEHTKAYLQKQRGVVRSMFGTIPDTDTVQVVMKKRKMKKNDYKGFTPPLDIAAMQELVHGYRESVARFNVSQGSISDPINLLSDKYSKRVQVNVDEERTIKAAEMYMHIDQAFIGEVQEFCSKYDEENYSIDHD